MYHAAFRRPAGDDLDQVTLTQFVADHHAGQLYCELQRDWAREATVPGFMGVFENFDGFNAEKAMEHIK